MMDNSIALSLQVLVVEDDWTVRSALADYLTRRKMSVITAESYETAVAAASQTLFDVAVIDIVLPRRPGERANFRDNTGLDVAREVRRLQPELGIIFLSAYVDRGPEVIQMFMEGHDHIVYLAKGSKPAELLDALHTVTGDRPALHLGAGITNMRESLLDHAKKALTSDEEVIISRALDLMATLSEAEKQVMALLGSCLNRHEVAARLNVTPKAVDYHINNTYDKLLLHNLPNGYNPSSLLIKIHLLHQMR